MWIVVNVLGWAISKNFQALPSSHIGYYVDASFCNLVLPHFHEDSFLSWQHFGCEDLRSMLRKSFDVWEHNSGISFDETFDSTRASLIVDVDEGFNDERTLAYWTDPYPHNPNSTTFIRLNPNHCWYTDHEFCYIVHTYRNLFLSLLVSLFTAALLFLTFVICRTSTRRVDSVLRLVIWTVLFMPPLVYVSTVRPCDQCYDFMMVLMHEVGHALQLHHPNVVESGIEHRCGCKENSVVTDVPLCGPKYDSDSIMFSKAPHRDMACLSRDDVDAVRTLYGGACDEHVRCYRVVHFASLFRIAIALVYSFVFSWGIVVFRNMAGRAWRRAQRKRLAQGIRLPTYFVKNETRPTPLSSSIPSIPPSRSPRRAPTPVSQPPSHSVAPLRTRRAKPPPHIPPLPPSVAKSLSARSGERHIGPSAASLARSRISRV